MKHSILEVLQRNMICVQCDGLYRVLLSVAVACRFSSSSESDFNNATPINSART